MSLGVGIQGDRNLPAHEGDGPGRLLLRRRLRSGGEALLAIGLRRGLGDRTCFQKFLETIPPHRPIFRRSAPGRSSRRDERQFLHKPGRAKIGVFRLFIGIELRETSRLPDPHILATTRQSPVCKAA